MAGIQTQASASAGAMYSQSPRSVHGESPFGPGTVARAMAYLWVGSGLWLVFVGMAAASY